MSDLNPNLKLFGECTWVNNLGFKSLLFNKMYIIPFHIIKLSPIIIERVLCQHLNVRVLSLGNNICHVIVFKMASSLLP